MPNTNYIEFGVAYRNPEGRDFCGEPWVLPGLMNLEDALLGNLHHQNASRQRRRYRTTTCFLGFRQGKCH